MTAGSMSAACGSSCRRPFAGPTSAAAAAFGRGIRDQRPRWCRTTARLARPYRRHHRAAGIDTGRPARRSTGHHGWQRRRRKPLPSTAIPPGHPARRSRRSRGARRRSQRPAAAAGHRSAATPAECAPGSARPIGGTRFRAPPKRRSARCTSQGSRPINRPGLASETAPKDRQAAARAKRQPRAASAGAVISGRTCVSVQFYPLRLPFLPRGPIGRPASRNARR